MAEYKRLDLEKFGGNIDNRTDRLLRGLLYEANTPQYSIPYSDEGTTLYQNIDGSLIFGRFQNRAKIIKLIREYYPDFEVKKFKINQIDSTIGDEYVLTVKYKPTGETIPTSLSINT